MVVSDNGPGMPLNPNFTKGIGIANTRARLQQLYGDRFAFEFSSQNGSGLDVMIQIPIHFDPLARPSEPVELNQIA
jgi:sensor histidine kinase YesM